MRVMILAKTTPEAEANPRAGGGNSEGEESMGRFHKELADAGILLAAGALQPTSRGVRLRYERKGTSVTDGPFAEAKELIGGYWIWEVSSVDHALEWLSRAPMPEGFEVEVRPIEDGDVFGLP